MTNRRPSWMGVNSLCLVLLSASVAWGQAKVEGVIAVRERYTKQEQLIPMRDGVKLFTSIYTPKDTSKKYPILLQRTPYSVGPYGAGEDKYRGQLGPSLEFEAEGYIYVFQDVG